MRRLFLVSLLLISGLFFTFSLASLSHQSAEAGSNVPGLANPSALVSPSPLISLASPSVLPSLAIRQEPTGDRAISRRAPSINGRLEGSIQQLTPENVTLNGGATITEKLYVPGTPTVRRNGNPNFGGVIEGSGSAIPTNYQVTLNGNATLGNLVNRTNPVALTPVPAPPTPTGTRDVSLNNPNDQIGDFATLRNLSLNGNAGTRSVPPGTYGNFTVNGSSVLIFGIANATEPASYNLQGLTLNGGTQLQIVGPVTLTLRNGTNINGTIGNAANPQWLTLNVSNGGVTLNGGSQMFGKVNAPAGSVTVNSRLTGNVICDRLTVNGGGVVTILAQAPQDTTAPVITITEPAQGLITKLSPITVSGTVTDTSAVTVTVNGQPINLSGTQFSTAVTLAEGSNTITVLATDTFGNVGTVSRNITLDTTAPVLTITSPQDGSTTTEAQLTITGTVTDATTTTVTVNNVAAVRNGNEFSALVSLVEGPNTFIIRAEDAAGNQTQSTRTVTLQVPHDTTPPVINLTEPTEGLITNVSPVTVSGIVTDASAVTVTVNNQLATLSGTQFTASVVLTEGSNTIAVSATDAFGNASSASRTVVLDTTAPVLTVTSPQDGSTTTETQITVVGTITDATTTTVKVNNVTATQTGNDFSAVIPLVEGPNTLLVQAIDAAGNQTESTVTVTGLPPNPLSVYIIDPDDGSYTNTNPLTIKGSASGQNLTVMANDTPLSVTSEGIFKGQIPLVEGPNTIRLVVSDTEGHRLEIVRTVILDTVPPTISNVIPAADTLIVNDKVDIQGIVTDSSPILSITVRETEAEVAPGTGARTFIAKDVPIYEFNNFISISVLDAAKNFKHFSFNLKGKDKTPPPPPTVFPIPSLTRLTVQTIEGWTEPGSKVHITGAAEPVKVETVSFSGLFVASVLLRPGTNTLTVTTQDQGGNDSDPVQVSILCNPNLPPSPPGQAWQINTANGNGQRGLINSELPRPFVALVTDSTGTPVPNVPVTFTVMRGGGQLVGATSNTLTVLTNGQGYAVVRYICGADSGNPIVHPKSVFQMIRADFEGNTSSPAQFFAQGLVSPPNTPTSVSGDVLDQNLRALPNVLIRLGGQQTRTNEDGSFRLTNVPSGPHQVLEVIGRDQVTLPGRWPNISFDIDVLPGIDNRLGRPFFLPKVNAGIELPLDEQNIVTEDTTYELRVAANEAPIQVTARAGTQVLFPPDITDKRFSVTRIPVNRIPMALEDGRATNLYISVQPSGAIFDPPLEVTFPNLDGEPAGNPVLLMSFDHDAGRYVQAGTGHVSADGKTVSSDSGSGIRVGAWHGFPPVAPSPETDGTGGGDGPEDCEAWFCGVPAVPLGDGFYRANVPSRNGVCQFEAKCRCQCECQTCPQRNEKEKRQANTSPCGGGNPQIKLNPIPGLTNNSMYIQNKVTEVLVGHKVTLTCETGLPASFNWSSDKKVLIDYKIYPIYGQYEEPSAEQLTDGTITFYFPLEGIYDVVCSYILHNGTGCSLRTTFNVYRPNVTLTTVHDYVDLLRYNNPNLTDKLVFGYSLDGVKFVRLVSPNNSLPNSLAQINGEYEFLQIVHYIKIKAMGDNIIYGDSFFDEQAENLVDSNYPPFFPRKQSQPVPQPANERTDSPNFPLRSRLEKIATNQQFFMHVLYRPGPQHGWVPIRRVYWAWEAEVELNSAKVWTLIGREPKVPGTFADFDINSLDEFPKWKGWGNDFINKKYGRWLESLSRVDAH